MPVAVRSHLHAAGAAAVLHGPDATAQQRDDAARTLRGLRGVSVVQEVSQPTAPGQLRYGMHPLVRGLAIDMRREQPDSEHGAAVTGFVWYMLCKVGGELTELDETATSAPVAAVLLSLESPNIAAMLQLVDQPAESRARDMLEAESQLGTTCRGAMYALASCALKWGQLQLAAEAGRAACQAWQRMHGPTHPGTLIT